MKNNLIIAFLCLSFQATAQLTTESLGALASAFSVASTASGSVPGGKTINLRLQPWPVDLRLDQIISGDLNLTWISKNVRFNNEQVESLFSTTPFNVTGLNAILSGGMPARPPVMIGTLPGVENLSGVPGALSQLRGGLPLKITVPVKVEVQWIIGDKTGNVPGTEYIALPADLKGPNLSIAFVPVFTELTSTPSLSPRELSIQARVTLTVAGVPPHIVDLPKIPFSILPVPVPRVAVFFRHTNFAAEDGGAALITVPKDSPLANLSSLNTVLNTLEQTLGGVRSISNIASFLFGIDQLQTALAAQPHVKFKKANSNNNINNFNDIVLIQNGVFTNDIEAEDELSSVILIGPPNARVRCYNARNRESDEGEFELKTGTTLLAIVKSLHSSSPNATPSGSTLDVRNSSTEDNRFGDELSSLDFMD